MPAPLQLLIFGPPKSPTDLIIWAIEKLASMLISGLANIWNAKKLENEMNNAPSPVVFNGTPYCFYSSSAPSGGNCLYYQYNNGSDWVQGTSLTDYTCTSEPSAVVFNNTLYVFFEQDNPTYGGSVLVYISSSDGSTWQGVEAIMINPGAYVQAQNNPSAVVFNGSLYVFYQGTGPSAGALFNAYTSDCSSWVVNMVPDYGPNGSGSYIIDDSPSAVAFTNPGDNEPGLYVYFLSTEKTLNYNMMSTAGYWQGVEQIPQITSNNEQLGLSATPSAFVYNDLIWVIYDSGGQLYYITSADGDVYTTHLQFGQISFSNSPSVVAYNNELVFTAMSPGGNGQMGYSVTTPGGNWAFMSAMFLSNTGFAAAGANCYPCAAVFNSNLYCFTQCQNSTGLAQYSIFNGDSWSSQTQIAPGGNNTSAYLSCSPAPVVFNNDLYLFFNQSGKGGWLYYTSSSDGSNWSEVINVAGTGMSYTPSPVVYNGDLYVFCTGQGDRGEIWFNRTTGGSGAGLTWAGNTEITCLNNSSDPASSYNGVVAPVAIVFNNQLLLFFISSDWNISYMTYQGNNSWSEAAWLDNGGTGYGTGCFTAVTYDDPSGVPTLAVYFQGPGNNGLLYSMSTTDASSTSYWSGVVQCGVPLPQGVTPPGIVQTAVSWAVACISGEPASWWDTE
jgi:hypothetical protein